ncbi:LADA_0D05424g1_1 [Lachancea dasiensis]|uniref:LADA_0D05424g1_1 n=1 Tax=Lachancea dasiensis TaxID=1072105 RepID=A0A1G4J5F8_9SACH|nr:LADA_0D05424g1_1 [Lachancea dasiensis]
MDWAVKSARKKTRFLQGGSRSIVESLNRFNEVITEGQDAISAACLASSKWLDNEMLNLKLGSKLERSFGTSEKNVNELKAALEESTPRKLDHHSSHDTPGSKQTTIAERSESLKENESPISQNDMGAQASSAELSSKARTQTLKSSPWSPYKSERTTFATELAPLNSSNKGTASFNVIEAPDQSSGTQGVPDLKAVLQTTSISPSLAETHTAPLPTHLPNNSLGTSRKGQPIRTSATVKIDRTLLRDRSQRRSNMFIPLPDKDPLIIHPTNTTSLPIKHEPMVTAELKGNENSELKRSMGLSYATRLGNSNIKSGITNVFDRLSSNSTLSFDNKATSRSPTRETKRMIPGRLTFRENLGSPKARRSPKVDQTNLSIQETLKNIFDSHPPQLGQGKRSTREDEYEYEPATSVPTVKRASLIPKLSGRTAVSPNSVTDHQLNLINRKTSNAHFKDLPSEAVLKEQSKNTELQPLATEETSPLLLSKSKQRTRRGTLKEDSRTSKNVRTAIQHTNGVQPTPLSGRSLTGTTPLVEQGQQEILCEASDGRKKPIKHQERLTKFQLPPLAGSEKQDVKKKLDKRLSEVMRSQKEQTKRNHEKLKRRSNVEDDLKQRKSRIFQDSDYNKAGKSFGDSEGECPQSKFRNTILYDLNTADHRQMVNGVSEETNLYDTTLPDIDSDSDAEDNSILAPWANSPYLEEQLLAQQNWDPEKIFGPIPPLHTDEIFQNSRLSKLKSRQSLSRQTMESRK